jgi:hypothetical protein
MSLLYFLLEEVFSDLLSLLAFEVLPLLCLTTGSFEAELSELLRDLAAGAEVSGLLFLAGSAFVPACEEAAGFVTEVPPDLLLLV